MEINDLRYFVTVAEYENINKASESLYISPGAVSKAIARLENELEVKLFRRERQRIFLSEAGRSLQQRANCILDLEEEARLEIGARPDRLEIHVGGEELLLSQFSLPVLEEINSFGKPVRCVMEVLRDQEIFDKLKRGSIHIGLTSQTKEGFTSRVLGKTKYRIVAGKKHPLAKKRSKSLPIDRLLDFDFILPDQGLLGYFQKSQSTDGWRDDQFPRNIGYRVNSIHTMVQLIQAGKGLAYLPDYLITQMQGVVIEVTGCRYHCQQTIYKTAYQPQRLGWLHQVF